MNWPLSDIIIMTPFNSIGFQMNPSRQSCEECLSKMNDANVIAMSILAGGYLSLDQATTYIKTLSKLSGVVIGVSTADHAGENVQDNARTSLIFGEQTHSPSRTSSTPSQLRHS